MRVIYLYLILLVSFSHGCKKHLNSVAAASTADYDKGMSYLDKQNDSAYYYFNKFTTSSKDSLQIALAYNNMAYIQSEAGDYYGSQESLLASLKHLNEHNEKDENCLISDYNELGRNSSNLKNYSTAIDYYDQALRLIKDDYSRMIALNNKAIVYQDEHHYPEAISILQSILSQSKTDKKEYARVLTNLAKTRWLQDSSYNASSELLEALKIRKDKNDHWGLNSSYAHLADYYMHSHPDSALIYALKMYENAQQLNSPDDRLQALQKLVSLSPPVSAKQYFLQYQQLSDSLQTIRNTAKNQFALIRYEAEKNKSDILRLEKDNSENKVQIIQLWFIISGIACLLIAVFFWYRRRQIKMKAATQSALREQQLKTSQKVHDVVANGLYQLMTGVEHDHVHEKDQLLDELESLYLKSRDISHEKSEVTPEDFQSSLSASLTSFASSERRVFLVGLDSVPWDQIKPMTKKEIELILLELMVNMKKHSAAANVVLRFATMGKTLTIAYQDDGVGLTPVFQYGKGLSNTENRITRIGGQITFNETQDKGLKIKIFIPNA